MWLFIFASGYFFFQRLVWSSYKYAEISTAKTSIPVNNVIELWIFSVWNPITLWLNLYTAWLLRIFRRFNNVGSIWRWNLKWKLGWRKFSFFFLSLSYALFFKARLSEISQSWKAPSGWVYKVTGMQILSTCLRIISFTLLLNLGIRWSHKN